MVLQGDWVEMEKESKSTEHRAERDLGSGYVVDTIKSVSSSTHNGNSITV